MNEADATQRNLNCKGIIFLKDTVLATNKTEAPKLILIKSPRNNIRLKGIAKNGHTSILFDKVDIKFLLINLNNYSLASLDANFGYRINEIKTSMMNECTGNTKRLNQL